MPRAKLAQIAMSVSDLAVSGAWYEEVLALVQSGGAKFSGDLVEQVTGVAGADLEARWLLDRQECFQYELFKVNNPPARALPKDSGGADEGYAMIGVHVAEFDATLARAVAFGSPAFTDPVGPPGHRRALIKDPDGILVELMEDDVRQDARRGRPWSAGSALRFVTIVVPDPDETAAFLRGAFGATDAAEDLIHGWEQQALWPLWDAGRSARVVWAGDIAIELVRFEASAGAARSATYKLTDIGLLNVAFMFEDRAGLTDGFVEAQRLGATPNAPHLADFGGFAVMYAETRQRTSVEMLHVDAPFMKQLGFEPWNSQLRAVRLVEIDAASPRSGHV